jgi:hypothetical protein
MAQELRTQRQMIESLLERQAAQKVPLPANLAPADQLSEVYAPLPPQPLRA